MLLEVYLNEFKIRLLQVYAAQYRKKSKVSRRYLKKDLVYNFLFSRGLYMSIFFTLKTAFLFHP